MCWACCLKRPKIQILCQLSTPVNWNFVPTKLFNSTCDAIWCVMFWIHMCLRAIGLLYSRKICLLFYPPNFINIIVSIDIFNRDFNLVGCAAIQQILFPLWPLMTRQSDNTILDNITINSSVHVAIFKERSTYNFLVGLLMRAELTIINVTQIWYKISFIEVTESHMFGLKGIPFKSRFIRLSWVYHSFFFK